MEEKKKLPSGGGHAHTNGPRPRKSGARELRSRVDGRCLNIEHMSRKSPGVLNATENRSHRGTPIRHLAGYRLEPRRSAGYPARHRASCFGVRWYS